MPATSGNLGPGFDTLGMALSLNNYFSGNPSERFEFVARGSEAGGLTQRDSDPRKSLVYRAIQAAYGHRKAIAPPFHLELDCEIPCARGLGSSATAIVGGLMLASRFLEVPLAREELLELSTRLEGHPDNVTPALLGGLTAAAVDGNGCVEVARLRLPGTVRLLALVPDFKLSTAEARRVLPRSYTRADLVYNLSRVALLSARLARGNVDGLWTALDDRVHQPYRARLVTGFKEVMMAARSAGALGAFLSGAGPTILVLTDGERPRIAARLCQVFSSFGVKARAIWLETGRGASYVSSARTR